MPNPRRRPSYQLGVQTPQLLSPLQPQQQQDLENLRANLSPKDQDLLQRQAAAQQQQMILRAAQQAPQQQAPQYAPGPNWPQNNAAPGPSWAMLDAMKQQPDTVSAQQTQDDSESRAALAQALGYKTTSDVYRSGAKFTEPVRDVHGNIAYPQMSQLQGQFSQLPLDQQAKIYSAGGASFLDKDASGANLLQQMSDNKEKALTGQISEMGNMIAKGEMTFDPSSRKFYQMLSDPDNPMLPKKKTEISLLQAHILNEGMKRGMIPDISDLYGQGAPPTAPGVEPVQKPINPAILQKKGVTPEEMGVVSGGSGAYPLIQSVRNQFSPGSLSGGLYNTATELRNMGADAVNTVGTTIVNPVNTLANAAVQLVSGTNKRLFPMMGTVPTAPYAGGTYRPDLGDPKAPMPDYTDLDSQGNPYQ